MDIDDDPIDWHQPDEVLRLLLHTMAAKTGTGFDLTVLVHGFLVTGIATSAREWLENIGASTTEEGSTPWVDVAAALMPYLPPDRSADDEVGGPYPRYLHMRDVRFFDAAGNNLPAAATVWRCRLTAVAGWVMGTLRADGSAGRA